MGVERVETAKACMRFHIVMGLLQMLVCCVFCFSGDHAVVAKAFTGAHHQFAHNGEFELVLAFVFPHALGLSSFTLKLASLLVLVGTWSNPIAYCFIAFSGHHSDIMAKTFPDLKPGPYGTAADMTLTVCAITMISAILLLISGSLRHPKVKVQ